MRILLGALLSTGLLVSTSLHAEDGAAGWLRYAPLGHEAAAAVSKDLPGTIETLDQSPVVLSARSEAIKAIDSMLGRSLRMASSPTDSGALLLGTISEIEQRFPSWKPATQLQPEGYILHAMESHGHRYLILAGADPRGVLYGTFRLLEKIAEQQDIAHLNDSESPS